MAAHMTPQQIAAANAASWAHEHAMQAARLMLFKASGKLHGWANELVDVAIGKREPDAISDGARSVLHAATKACA